LVSQTLRHHDAPLNARDAGSLRRLIVTSIPAPTIRPTSVVLPVSKAVLWLASTAIIGLALYYFIGVDQGAVSVFGNDMHLHEFVHDARHLLGFPCH